MAVAKDIKSIAINGEQHRVIHVVLESQHDQNNELWVQLTVMFPQKDMAAEWQQKRMRFSLREWREVVAWVDNSLKAG